MTLQKIPVGVKFPLYEGVKLINAAIEEAETSREESSSALAISNQANDTANAAEQKADSVQSQFNQVVIEGDSSVESAQARVAADGTTYTTLQERLNQSDAHLADVTTDIGSRWVFVKAPKGESDHTQSIQNALNKLDGVGGVCVLPIGTFLTSKTLLIPSNVKLMGTSKTLTIIKPTPQFRDDMINGILGDHISWNLVANKNFNIAGATAFNSNNDIEVADIFFLFDDTRTSTPDDKNNCIGFNNCKRVIVRDCRFMNFGQHSIDLSGVQDGLVERTYSYFGYWSSIQVDQAGGLYQSTGANSQQSENIIIRDNYIEGNRSNYGAIQIHKNGGNNVRIHNNTIRESLVGVTTDDYYRDNWGIGQNKNLIISNNEIISNVENAIGVKVAKNVDETVIESNRVITPNGEPVYLRGGKPSQWLANARISNNYFGGRTATMYSLRGGSVVSNKFALTQSDLKIACDNFSFLDNVLEGFGVLLRDITLTDPRDGSTYTFINNNAVYQNTKFLSKHTNNLNLYSFKVAGSSFKLLQFLDTMVYLSTNDAFDFSELSVQTGIEIVDMFRIKKRNVTSTSRLTNGLIIGTQIYDETLKKPIWWDGTSWKDATGTIV